MKSYNGVTNTNYMVTTNVMNKNRKFTRGLFFDVTEKMMSISNNGLGCLKKFL